MVYALPPPNFTHGEILRWRRVGDLVLAEVAYAPGQRIHQHVHPHARFVLVLHGSLTELRGDETQTHGPSTLLFRRAHEPHAAPAWLARARALVEHHFAEPLPLASVARRVGVHPVHLARTFRRVYRTTVGGYLRQVRVDFARRELATSSAALSEIAAAAGF